MFAGSIGRAALCAALMLCMTACGGGGGGGSGGAGAAPAAPLVSDEGNGMVGGSGPATALVSTDLQPTGTVFHVSAAGDDGQPGTEAQPWQSLARVQAAIDAGVLHAGDAVLFARGQRFFGRLNLPAALRGSPSAPIVFGAYGNGDAPVLHGWRAITGWVPAGGDRWRATCADCTATPALLRLDGVSQRIARWPNADAANGGYRTIDSSGASSNGHNSITDPTLAASPNWSGGELVVRSTVWVLDRLPIAVHDGSRIDTGADATYPLRPGYGYFIQNHPDAIDLEGEWSYDAASQTLTMQSATDPNGRRVEVPIVQSVLTVRGSSQVALRDLVLQGSAGNLVDAAACTALRLTRMDLGFAGDHGARIDNCKGSTVEDSIVHDAMNFGLRLVTCGGCAVLRSTVDSVGLAAGMGANGEGAYEGVGLGGIAGAPARMRYSIVQHTGYLGVSADGYATVSESEISDFDRVKIDGGGIYTWGKTDITISDNFVHDAIGSTAGTPWTTVGTHGIYIDDNSERVAVSRNTVVNVGAAAAFMHNTRDTTLTDNWFIGAGEVGILMTDDVLGTDALENSTVTGNRVLVQGVPVLQVGSTLTATFFATLGTLDRNLYCDPFADVRVGLRLPGVPEVLLALPAWRIAQGRDLASATCGVRRTSGALADVAWRATNVSSAARTFNTPSEALVGLDGTTYAPRSAVTLSPFASIVLLRP
jgi:hypothetical protein